MDTTSIKKFANDICETTKKHSSELCTAVGVTGLITTAFLTARATVKAVRIVDEAERRKKEPLTKKEIVKLTWKQYISPAVVGGTSIACIINAQRVNMKRNAAIAGALQVTQTAFSEYKDEVVKTIGEKKEKVIKKNIADAQLEKNPPPSDEKQIIVTGSGDELCYDSFSGRYFKGNLIDIQKAVNTINQRLLAENYASVNDFWSEIGLPYLEMGQLNGWNIDDGMIDVSYSTHMTADGRPAIVISFDKDPRINYDMFA